MSKGLGQKIVIKFDKPLLGDVTGNQSAFTVTGDEYKYVNGPLLNRAYAVESAERPLVKVFYQEGFDGTADGVEVRGGLRLEGDEGAFVPEWHESDIKTAFNSSSAVVSVEAPANLSIGDMVLVFISGRMQSSIQPPDGFELIRYEGDTSSTLRSFVAAYYKIAGGSEPVEYEFSFATSSYEKRLVAIRVSNFVPSNPIDQNSGINSGSVIGTNIALPEIIATTNNSLLIALAGARASMTITIPDGMTEIFNNASDGYATSAGAIGSLESFGETGERVFGFSGSNRRAGMMFNISGGVEYITPIHAVASTSYSSTYSAIKAIDGDLSTRWMSDDSWGDQYIYFDLGEEKTISGFKIYIPSGFVDMVFDVRVSNTAENFDWVTVLENVTITEGGAWVEKSFESANARYVRYYMKSSGAYPLYGISETQIRIGEPDYIPFGTYITPQILTTNLPDLVRLQTQSTTPPSTSIKIEYGFGATTPTVWTEVAGLIPISGDFLWLKYTLETEANTVTPTLLAVWVEEAEAPPDTIILSFDTYNRFNNVADTLIVAYNQNLGTLAGARAVESFSIPFTPTELVPTPNHQHTINITGTVSIDFKEITYHKIYDNSTNHVVGAIGTGLIVDLIHIDDINP